MNTGIHHGHNRAWKVVGVMAERASPALLETYDRERRPVAPFTLDQALLRLSHPELHWDLGRSAERQQIGMAQCVGHGFVHGVRRRRCRLATPIDALTGGR